MTVIVFGISNCDTVKKARAWLGEHGVIYDFHDYKKAGVDADKLAAWIDVFGWDKVLNRAGSTFKKLSDDVKANLDETKAIAIMLAHPSAIKRPIVEYDSGALLGFNATQWESVTWFPEASPV